MNSFQPSNNVDSGLTARTKINNLGSNALGPEHNNDPYAHPNITSGDAAIAVHDASAAAHPDFVSRGRSGSKSTANPYTSEETDNIGSNIGANAYGAGANPSINATKYIGSHFVQTAYDLRSILTKYGGHESTMPGYFGFCLETESGTSSIAVPNDKYIGGFFCLSLNLDNNKAAYPFKVVKFSTIGMRQAYFRNATTPVMTAWESIGGGAGAAAYPIDFSLLGPTVSSANIDAAIGGWANFSAAVDAGRVFYNTGTPGKNNFFAIRRSATSIVFVFWDDAGKQIVTYTITNNSGTLSCTLIFNGLLTEQNYQDYVRNVRATTSQDGTVTLASNTGNSTDANKVPVVQSNGKLHPNVIPGSNYVYEIAYRPYTDTPGPDGRQRLVLIVKNAASAHFAAVLEVLATRVIRTDYSGTIYYSGLNLDTRVTIRSRVLSENGFFGSSYTVAGVTKSGTPIEGNDLVIPITDSWYDPTNYPPGSRLQDDFKHSIKVINECF